jgi:hypothetical protein
MREELWAIRLAPLRACAAAGLTKAEAARALGVSPPHISQQSKRFGIEFAYRGRGQPQRREADERDTEMARRYRDGETLEQIGNSYGISRERVRQLITKYHGLRGKHGGMHVATVQKRAERAAARDADCLAKYGCSVAQRKATGRKARAAYTMQRKNAQQRGIGWEMNFWQWWTIWQDSGHWAERGRGQGYGMCRRGDTGPYAAWNVYIAPCWQNSGDQPRFVTTLPIGVRKRRDGFTATRMIRGRRFHLGPFPTAEMAAEAYLAAGQRAAA